MFYLPSVPVSLTNHVSFQKVTVSRAEDTTIAPSLTKNNLIIASEVPQLLVFSGNKPSAHDQDKTCTTTKDSIHETISNQSSTN